MSIARVLLLSCAIVLFGACAVKLDRVSAPGVPTETFPHAWQAHPWLPGSGPMPPAPMSSDAPAETNTPSDSEPQQPPAGNEPGAGGSPEADP